jgi:hypothetical protein
MDSAALVVEGTGYSPAEAMASVPAFDGMNLSPDEGYSLLNLASGAVAVFSLCCDDIGKGCPEIGRTVEPKEGACEYAASDHKAHYPSHPARLWHAGTNLLSARLTAGGGNGCWQRSEVNRCAQSYPVWLDLLWRSQAMWSLYPSHSRSRSTITVPYVSTELFIDEVAKFTTYACSQVAGRSCQVWQKMV